jgi:hypothetical protein
MGGNAINKGFSLFELGLCTIDFLWAKVWALSAVLSECS